MSVEILKQIRDETRRTREELSRTREELSERIDHTNQRVDLLAEGQTRMATAITDLHGTMKDVTTLLRTNLELRPRVERCEQDIVAIRTRLDSPQT